MSNFGQAALGIVGGVAGFFLGGPTGAAYGFQLGLGAGTLLFPTQLPGVQGPRLSDSQQTISTVGSPMPWVFGAQTVAGIVNWASPIREVATTTTAGKGGPEQEQTTYTYFRSWSVILTDGEIQGVRRIWSNGKLVLDRSPQGDSETQENFTARLMKNEKFLEKVTIYLGTEDQLPDPTIESFEGVGNVPAFRGCSYVVFNDVQLLPEDGNRVPASMKFEVFTNGVPEDADTTYYSTELLFPWASSDPPINSMNLHTIASAEGGAPSSNPNYFTPAGGPWDDIESAIEAKVAQLGLSLDEYQGHDSAPAVPDDFNVSYDVFGWTTFGGSPSAADTDVVSAGLHYNHFAVNVAGAWGYIRDGEDSSAALVRLGVPADSGLSGMVNDIDGGYSGAAAVTLRSDSPEDLRPLGWNLMTSDGLYPRFQFVNVRFTVQRVPRAPFDPCEDPRSTQIPGVPDFVILDGVLTKCGAWSLINSNAHVLSVYSAGTYVSRYPLNPTLPLEHPLANDEAFWESAYNDAVAEGKMPEGLVYGVHYPLTVTHYYRKEWDASVVDLLPVSIASIVAAICARVGSRVDLLYDVTDLTEVFITGYKITNPTSARAAIDPLRSVGFFDCVESGIALKFPTRGKAAVTELTFDDLAAHFSDAQRPPNVDVQKTQDFELPRQVRVHYQSIVRDYDAGEESSPPRFDTRAESVVDVELSVAMPATQAAQSAEVMYRDLWAARYQYSAQVDISHARIEAADCLLLPVDGILERVRVTSAIEMIPNLRRLELVRDDDGAYVSTATGNDQYPQPPKLEYFGPVVGVMLDLPALDVTTDDDAGFYFAARPAITNGAFRGANLSRSGNADAGFETVATVDEETPIGYLLADLPAGPTTVVDWDTEIRVKLHNGALETRSLEDVLGGANAAAIGADDRWNIVQFIEAEQISTSVWVLRGLLQGRRGTEWFVGSCVENDAFVMLSLGTLARAQLADDAVNASLFYRSTAIGAGISTAPSVAFTGHGEALRPFSPVHIEGTRSANVWSFTWVRRDRLASDLDIPMSEAVEDYELDIMKNGAAIRTISVLNKSASYSEAQQVLDFGAVQDSITVRAYQISAAVGRSNPQEASFSV